MSRPDYKFEDGGYFMHKDNMDLCYEVLESYDIGNGISFYANVINLGYMGNPFTILNDNKFFVSYEDLEHYNKLTEEQMSSKRTKSGVPE